VSKIVLETRSLGFPWVTADPFLFCVHHDDAYPAGNEQLGPKASLAGRQLGQDFAGKDGWRMYHGRVVPGFPQHPHRGFETVTLVRRGLIDHSDSLGATARFGRGDVQWLTAGDGIVHSEMFPLVEQGAPNPLELFQIWLNLPGEDKRVPPHFTMLWNRDIPRRVFTDDAGRTTEVAIVAGQLDGKRAPPPPPRSWAARADTDVAIWTLRMQPGATWTVPPAANPKSAADAVLLPRLVAPRGGGEARPRTPPSSSAATPRSPSKPARTSASSCCSRAARSASPWSQHGPFVMNTKAEIQQAMQDYQRTRFGGWPWPADDPVHAAGRGRFAKHADGRVERIDE
jgi:redox-sensitive bicupin YhaK (pirin superfamily)